MRTSPSKNSPIKLLSRLMLPNLQELSSSQLLDLFLDTGKQFEQGIVNSVGIHELDHLQVQMQAIKDEISRKYRN